MNAYRGELHFTIAAADLAAADQIAERLAEAAEEIVTTLEGGSIGQMDPADVIEGSPLDQALKREGST